MTNFLKMTFARNSIVYENIAKALPQFAGGFFTLRITYVYH